MSDITMTTVYLSTSDVIKANTDIPQPHVGTIIDMGLIKSK